MTLLKKNKGSQKLFTSGSLPEGLTEDNHAFANEPLNELYTAIKQLKEIDWAVILLYLEEKSYQDIMEQSIESIWKEGFIDKGALIAPKVNNLYERKSIHIIDKFKRMFKINLNAIFIGSFVTLIGGYFAKIPVMGLGYFFVLNDMLLVNRKFIKSLKLIDKNVSSYEYLKSFSGWIKNQIVVNTKIARIYYPLFYIFMVLGFWFSPEVVNYIEKILGESHEIFYVAGIPVYWVLGNLLIMGIISLATGLIYRLDLNLVYGQVFKKLDEITADVEELRG